MGIEESQLSLQRYGCDFSAPNNLNRQERQAHQETQKIPMCRICDLGVLGGLIHSGRSTEQPLILRGGIFGE